MWRGSCGFYRTCAVSDMDLVHPNRPETWRNWPSPYLPPRFTEELLRIGGRSLDGRPMLRWAWGQTRTQFRRGKQRLLYIDERIPAIRHTRHVLKRALLVNADGVPQWETRVINEAPRVIPEGWLYEEELVSIEWIGEQFWYVEQLYKPEEALPNGDVFLPFGTPEEWEKIRYEDWEDPEVGMVPNCDILGPFPEEGRYTAIQFVAQPFSWMKYEDENVMSWIDDHGKPFMDVDSEGKSIRVQRVVGVKSVGRLQHGHCYRAPGEDTLQAIRAGWHVRENRHVEKQEQRSKNMFYQDELKRRAAREDRLGRARDYMKGEQWRWSSPDSGSTGGVGGGARAYITNTDALEGAEESK